MTARQDARVERAVSWGVELLVTRLGAGGDTREVARTVLLDVLAELGLDTSARVEAPDVELHLHRGPRTPGHDEDV